MIDIYFDDMGLFFRTIRYGLPKLREFPSEKVIYNHELGNVYDT